jgi:hypothetical protein
MAIWRLTILFGLADTGVRQGTLAISVNGLDDNLIFGVLAQPPDDETGTSNIIF